MKMKAKMKIFRAAAVLLAAVMLLSSCTSTTLIQSVPPGAKVYIDQEPVGTTPYMHADTKIAGSHTFVQLRKEGYQEFNAVIIRNEEVDVGAVVAGVFFWIPFLWVMKYKPVRTYELTPAP